MKELSEEIKEDLEELIDLQKNSIHKDTFCETYLASLSKRGYAIEEYKSRYFKILREKFGFEE